MRTYCGLAAALLSAVLTLPSPLLAKDLIVGQSLDLSGATNLGKDFSNGIRTYFDSVNARGGVRGRKIQFVQLDDGGRAADAQLNIEKLLREQDADVLIAPTSAETLSAAASMPKLRSTSLTLLGAPTGAEVDAGGGSFRVLPLRATFREEAKSLLDTLRTFNDGAIALVRGDGPDAEASHSALREEVLARKLNVAFEGTTALWLVRKPSPERIGAVVISGDAIGVMPALQQTRRIAPQAILMGFSTVDHRTLVELVGAAAKGMMITQVVPPPGKTIHPFQREHRALMKQYRDEPPSQHTLEGYIVARILVAAYERVEGEPTPAKLSSALRTIGAIDFGPMRISPRAESANARYVDQTAISSKGGLVE
jgi:branched-chain amino acid transport system substrate-binding protein